MALSYKNDDQQDERLNPASKTAQDLSHREHESIEGYDRASDGLDDHPISAGVAEGVEPSKNIDAVKDSENAFNYRADQSGRSSTKDTRNFGQKVMGLVKSKKGATAGVFGGLGLIGFVFSTLLSPALLLMHVKNVFLNDLDDASSAISIRSDRMMRNMIKDKVSVRAGFCSKAVTVRCKFSTMSPRMVKKFTKAGFEVDGKKRFGRTVINEIRYTASDGTVHHIKNPQDMKNFARTPEGRSALFKAFNPKTAAFLNSKFSDMLRGKFKLTKQSLLNGKDKKSVQESFNKATGAANAPPADEGGRFKEEVEKSKAMPKGIGSAAIAGISTACTAYQTAYVITYGIKAAKMAAYASFAYTFLTETDKIIAGNAEPEVVSTLGDQMTSLTADKQINTNASGGDIVDNPDYGKSPTDSQGYRLSAYGDAGAPNASTARFSLGIPTTGIMGAIGVFLTLMNKPGVNKRLLGVVCGALGNPIIGTIAQIGICAALGLTGAGLVACVAVNGAIAAIMTLAIGYGLGKLTTYLIKQYGPMLLDEATRGTDVGNAMAVGSGAIFGGMAQANGMMPSKKEDMKTYFAYTDEARKEAIAANVYDAKSQPFNAYNQYSFAGGILQPLSAAFVSKPSTGSQLASLINTVTASFGSLGKAGAAYNMPAQKYNEQRYSMCDDVLLNDANVDPDMLCTVRYSMSPAELDMDPDTNLDYMINNDHIDATTGEAKSDEYKKFITYCGIGRTDMIGSTEDPFDDDPWHTGKACSDKSEMMSNFRVYTMADNISTSFEEDPAAGAITSSQGAKFRVATFNILHADDPLKWEDRLKDSVKTLKDNNIDIAGLQEARPKQQVALKSDEYGADVYDMWPTKAGDGADPDVNPDSVVIWNKEKFELVSASQKKIKYDGNRKLNIVKLRYIEGGAQGPEFYVLNTHDPIDRRADAEGGPKDRKDNNEMYADLVKNDLKDAPVVFTGDFNSHMTVAASKNKPLDGKRENLAYCILTRDGILWHASDALQNKTGECPSEKDAKGNNGIDHIFISTTMRANNYDWVPEGKGEDGSDHNLVYSDVEIPGIESSNAGSDFVISTYNIKAATGARMDKVVNNLKNNKMDIVGFQEMKDSAYRDFQKKAGDTYAVFPSSIPSYNPKTTIAETTRSIAYNKSKFKLVKYDTFKAPVYTKKGKGAVCSQNGGCEPTDTPILWLQDITTGQMIIVMNTHNSAYPQNASDRKNAAEVYLQKVKQLSTEGLPIFFTGDFNEGYGVRTSGNVTADHDYRNLFYCKAWEAKLLVSAAEQANNDRMYCSPDRGYGGVDYIYTSPSVKTDWYKEISADPGRATLSGPSASDHNAAYAHVIVPGTGGSEVSGGLQWPVDKKYWGLYKTDFLDAHTMSSGTFTNPYVKGVAADISRPPDGSPIYSMLSGTVTTEDNCKIRIQSKISGGILLVAYGHSTEASHKVKVGDTVTAGQQIAAIGNTCNSDGGHLHVDMTYNGKHICPQDVFIAMGKNQTPDFAELTKRGIAPCGRL